MRDKKYTSQNLISDIRLCAVLKFEVMRADPEEREDVLEVAKTLEDILHSVEVKAPHVLDRQVYKNSKIQNRAELLREQEGEIRKINENRTELNRQRRR